MMLSFAHGRAGVCFGGVFSLRLASKCSLFVSPLLLSEVLFNNIQSYDRSVC